MVRGGQGHKVALFFARRERPPACRKSAYFLPACENKPYFCTRQCPIIQRAWRVRNHRVPPNT
eukprot:6533244-Prymnesium_polylepis.2